MRKVSGNSEEKWWVALCKMQRSQAWHIYTLLKEKSSCPKWSCTSPLVSFISWKHFSAAHHSPDGGRVSVTHVLQKLSLPLGWVKLGLLGLACNNAISISFLSKAQKSCEWLGPILELHLGFDSKVCLDAVLWVLLGNMFPLPFVCSLFYGSSSGQSLVISSPKINPAHVFEWRGDLN